MDASGRLVCGIADGRIIRVDPISGRTETLGKTPGRPLGLEVCADGTILICDSPAGLLRLDPASGALETLVTHYAGRRLIFCSNVVAARDGTAYFSTSSSRYPFSQYMRDIIEHVPSGQVFRRRTDGTVELVLDELYFANGLALAPDGAWIIVAETNAQHLRRLRLSGEQAGHSEIFARVAGFPDNLSLSAEGLIWLAIASPDTADRARIHAAPLPLRRLVARLPDALRPKAERVGWLRAFDAAGNVVHDFRWTDGTYAMFTGTVERDGVAFIASLAQNALLRFSVA
jgi:sugar lactone lactonase YvrE